ncbi:MAG: hypothetical protein ACE5Q6_12975, partial [Dehalococcoidia bacterium]
KNRWEQSRVSSSLTFGTTKTAKKSPLGTPEGRFALSLRAKMATKWTRIFSDLDLHLAQELAESVR